MKKDVFGHELPFAGEKINQLRKQILELEKRSCVLLCVRGKDAKITAHKNLDKPRQVYQPGGGHIWHSATPLIEYKETE